MKRLLLPILIILLAPVIYQSTPLQILKLKVFEQGVVTKSKAKTKKTAVRKAETPLQVLSAYQSFLK